ncbi:MAG: fluoride efflux transporter CrcB [Candidatus Omnitrophica bacterium CG11_big_fil_rev_8_21_14_0_20_42_13]|uniref:Fluoride-specific ion channel FluC n=1 Tax=Candidatus Ghiorseimicrobium undicola TaxID=1974746 RepID=A0A2H0LY20_9BACT|nr:MAG: fluoride efflux transporter CrcB [Candidatus Omnitrophica bacterium CG11_big_fil_rev_8_21_14_0_20_42_13]
MLRFFVIALGGAIGTLLRYIIGGLDYRFSNGVFPVSTLIINISGSFAIGFLWGGIERFAVSPNMRLFIFIGILGGYTTFSAFSLESFNLFRDGEYKIALSNIMLSNVLAICFVFLGFFAARSLINLLD